MKTAIRVFTIVAGLYLLPYRLAAQIPQFTATLFTDSTTIVSQSIQMPNGDLYLFGSCGISGHTEALIARTDPSGHTIWAKTYGGGVYDIFINASVTLSGDFYITGDTKSYGNGMSDMLICRADTSGNMLWSIAVGGNGDDAGRGIVTSFNGDVVVAGGFTGMGNSSVNCAIVRVDSNGTLISKKMYGTNSHQVLYTIKEISPNKLWMCGAHFTGPTSQDIFIMETDSLLDSLSLYTYDSGTWDRHLSGYYRDSTGVTYVVTRPGGAGWFDTTDVAIMVLDSNNNLLYAKTYPLPGMDRNGSLQKTNTGFMLIGISDSYDGNYRGYSYQLDDSLNIISSWITTSGAQALNGIILPSSDGGYYTFGSITLPGQAPGVLIIKSDSTFHTCSDSAVTTNSTILPYIRSTTSMTVRDTGFVQPIAFGAINNLNLNDSMFCYECQLPLVNFSISASQDTVYLSNTTSGIADSIRIDYGDGSPISDSLIHQYLSNGTFTICMYAYNACGVDSFCQPVTMSTTVQPFQIIQNVSVYPVPADQEVIFSTSLKGAGTYTIIDISGRAIQSSTISSLEKFSIDSNNFATGTYFIIVSEGDKHCTARFLIAH